MPCCYDPVKELIFLGPGVPLLFIFARLGILLLVILTLFFSIFAVVTNLRGDSCDIASNCQTSIFVRLSIANKIYDSYDINIQNYLLVGFIGQLILWMQLMLYMIRRTDQRSDELINSPSDYSLMISQLPEGWTVNDVLEMI
jgi:hypothetical protein